MEKEKFYYATEVDPEQFDYRDYWFDDDLVDRLIWIGGNRDFTECNEDLRGDVVRHLEDCRYDVEVARDNDEELTDEEVEVEVKKTIRYYFGKKDVKETFTDEEYLELERLCNVFNTCSSREENGIICQVLEIIYGKKFKETSFSGCSQGDWVDVICPEDTAQEYLDYLSAIFFGTGTEFRITETKVDDPDSDEVDNYYDYTYLWKKSDVKTWLAKNIGCKEEELKVRYIKDTYTTKHYTYEED